MEKNDGSGGSSSSKDIGGVHQEQGESSAKRIKCSIEEAAFCCDECSEPLRPPIFQSPEGQFLCWFCEQDDDQRSLGMERAVESILVDCPYAEHGCTEQTAYYHAKHRLMCPHAPCECPEPGCDFAGKRAEILDHLTAGAGRHKWPSTTFQYWVPFDLRIVEPGTHVLRCKNGEQLFIVRVEAAAEPTGFAISLVYVEHINRIYNAQTGFQCSVFFSYSARHRGTSTMPVWPLSFSGSRPPICVVPNKVSTGPDGAGNGGIVITVNITCIHAVDEDDDLDDSIYDESDEDMAMSDEDDRANC